MEKPTNLKSEYHKYIRAYVDDQKRDGIIGYWGSVHASKGAEELFERAESLVKVAKYPEALTIYQAIVETLVPVIQFADDSRGTIGDAINNAVEGIRTCAISITQEEKENLFKYLVKEADKKQYHEWDWEMDLLDIAAELTDDDRKTRILFDLLDKISSRKDEKGSINEFTYEHALKLKCLVYKKRGLIPELRTLIRDNINFTAIREIAIQDALDDNRIEEAKVLAVAGITMEEQKKYRGYKGNWFKRLLDIAKKENNIEDIKKYSRILFLDSGDMEYYEELRRQYPAFEWHERLQKLLKEVPERICMLQDIPGKIYVREENWEALLLFVKQRANNIYYVTRYHEHLVKRFPKELSEMYGQALRKTIENAHNRSDYHRVCPIIKNMEECGFKEDVRSLVEWIRKTYSFRTALQDELKKVVKNRY